MDWRLVCVTQRSPRTDDVASVWRPVGVLCYACLGDVLRKGRDPPSHPVTMFLKNPPATEQATPVFEFPVHYLLVWRDFSGGGLTVWRPQPPAGYQALGCLAAKGLDPPARTAVVCVRKVRLLARRKAWFLITSLCNTRSSPLRVCRTASRRRRAGTRRRGSA